MFFRLIAMAFVLLFAAGITNELCNECLWYSEPAMEYPEDVGW